MKIAQRFISEREKKKKESTTQKVRPVGTIENLGLFIKKSKIEKL